MRRRRLHTLLVLFAAAGVTAAAARPKPGPVGKQVSVAGMVIDLACYFAKGDSGATHLQCAQMCAKAGVPFGILTSDQKLFIPAKHGENANAGLMPYLEQKVSVAGTAWSAAGTNTIEISTIAPESLPGGSTTSPR